MVAAFFPVIVEVFSSAAVVGFGMCILAKGINVLYRAFTRGEIIV